MTTQDAQQERMQALVDKFMVAVSDDMAANGAMDPNALILTIGAFAIGTVEALEARTGVHRDTVFKILVGTLFNLMAEPPAPIPDTEEKPN